MDVTIFDTPVEVGHAAAGRLADALARDGDLVIGLPAGNTPVDTYVELQRLHAAGEVTFANATAFLLDEFVGLHHDHPGSFCRFITEHLLSGIDLDPEKAHSLDGTAPDPEAECERYEETIAASGGVGLMLLGIGTNGHVGFNEPGDGLLARTHRVRLSESTRQHNAGLFGGDVTRVPEEALSMGMGTILRSEAIILLATGTHKASAVAAMLQGPVTTHLPASLLQLHRRVEVFLDRAAAAGL